MKETDRTPQQSHQQDIQQSNTRQQETHSQLPESDTRLKDTQIQLQMAQQKTKNIHVHRFPEPEKSSNTSESTSNTPMEIQIRDTTHTDGGSNTGSGTSQVDTKQVIRYIKEVIRTYYPALSSLFEGLLPNVATQMLGVGLIPHAIEKNPTFNGIMTSFLAGFAFKDELEEIEEYCVKFFDVFYEIGGQFIYAANKIKKSIQKTVKDKLGVQLNIY